MQDTAGLHQGWISHKRCTHDCACYVQVVVVYTVMQAQDTASTYRASVTWLHRLHYDIFTNAILNPAVFCSRSTVCDYNVGSEAVHGQRAVQTLV